MSHQALFHQPPHVQVYQDGDDEDDSDDHDDDYGDDDDNARPHARPAHNDMESLEYDDDDDDDENHNVGVWMFPQRVGLLAKSSDYFLQHTSTEIYGFLN